MSFCVLGISKIQISTSCAGRIDSAVKSTYNFRYKSFNKIYNLTEELFHARRKIHNDRLREENDRFKSEYDLICSDEWKITLNIHVLGDQVYRTTMTLGEIEEKIGDGFCGSIAAALWLSWQFTTSRIPSISAMGNPWGIRLVRKRRVSDGTRGIMFANRMTPDGWFVREDGSWDEKR